MDPRRLAAFLEDNRTAILTCNSPDGYPHATAMWYLVDHDRVSMWTYAKSQKARNLERDPRCSVLVESGEAYNELKGVLISGEVEFLRAVDDIAAIGRGLYDRYTLPRTGIPAEDGPIVEIRRQAEKRVGLRLRLDRVASWDHSKLGS